MTAPQSNLYWRTWAAAACAQHWHGTAAEMRAARQECFVSPRLDEAYQAVWRVAEVLAGSNHRALVGDDFRYAAHIVATGRQVSSKRLTNAELDRVLALFRLLADPENLANVEAWFNPDAGTRKRYLHLIEQWPAKYVAAISRDKFKGKTNLSRLTLDQLRQLSLTLRHRHVTQQSPGNDAVNFAPANPLPCPVL
jgi:hypothetical protein